jgi:signal transduction histidine kinase
LAIINCSIEELQKKYKGQETRMESDQRKYFRLNSLLEQNTGIQKTEKGKLKLSVSYGDIGDFVMRICRNIFHLFRAGRNKIEFIYRSEPEHIPAWFDKTATDMILYNLLSNAFKTIATQGKSWFLSAQKDNYRILNMNKQSFLYGNRERGSRRIN